MLDVDIFYSFANIKWYHFMEGAKGVSEKMR